ncbi:MAG: efflux RND transporter permease subunit [Verrucomicrobiota bacterium]
MIAWFTRNGVAANLLMFVICAGGAVALMNIKVELFPPLSLDTISITVPYRGASPEEVERGVILRIEESLEGLEGVKKLTSFAREGVGVVQVEAERGQNVRSLLDDVKTRIDGISTFPVETERPIVEELLLTRDILYIAIGGPTSERTLKELAEKVRTDVVALPGISQAEVVGTRDYELAIEVTEQTLREYGLTFDEVVAAVRRSSIDLPGGSIRSEGGEILLRTLGQAYRGEEFANLVLRTRPDGTRLRLGDIATINDGFVDQEVIARFDGQPAAFVEVRETGDENPLDISAKVDQYIERVRPTLPEEVQMAAILDTSFYLAGRLELMIRNGLIGLALVFIVLTIFLRPSLAFFVALGIPVSFLGTFFLGPWVGISINLISLFAFVLVLGIVVDDAIVVGESVFTEFQRRGPGVDSAIRGTHLVAMPVTFAVITTMVAFLPIFAIPGIFGKFFAPIPWVVILTLAFSLVQSKLVLPYHLSLCKVGDKKRRDQLNPLSRAQRGIADALERFITGVYQPFLNVCLRERWVTAAVFLAIGILCIGMVRGGWVRMVGFPSVPSDFIVAQLELPEGTQITKTEAAIDRMEDALDSVLAQLEAEGQRPPVVHRAIFIGTGPESQDTNRADFLLELTKSERRDISAPALADRWREEIGGIPGARRLIFQAEAAAGAGSALDFQLSGSNLEELRAAASEVKDKLGTYEGVFDITDSYAGGKREIKLRIKPEGQTLGLTVAELGTQVRQAFFGAEAQRIQRGRDDVRVMVRYPREERESIANLENMRVRTPTGVEVPFEEVAEVEMGRGFPTIRRVDTRQVVNVTAEANKAVADLGEITKEMQTFINEELSAQFPGVVAQVEGQQRETRETNASLLSGGALVLVVIYALLAVAFRTYLQPLLVMIAIPFGFVGAVFGHWITGQSLSTLSFLGLLAVIGVVVNDSLVLVDFINRFRREGGTLIDAVYRAGAERFRPILLTSLTTFVGLVPILMEQSLQAQFLIPMATSLAFGVLFATFITLLLVPAVYLMLEDVLNGFRWLFGKEKITIGTQATDA